MDAVDGVPDLGRFRLERLLGGGGMGVVWLATDLELRRSVALKLMFPTGLSNETTLARLRQEAYAMARLSHPNVAVIYDVGHVGEHAFIAMEPLLGGTLRHWLETRHSRAEILDKFVAAGRGLAAAHRANVIHHDFKPENVLLGTNGELRVADFGIAAITDDVETATDATPGTTRYMAPERMLGLASDARSDQFSFGVALWEGLAGSPPFRVDAIAGAPASALLVRAILDRNLGSSARIPVKLRPILQRALEFEPSARFSTLDELLAAVERATRPRRRRRIALGVGLAGLLVIMLLAAAVLHPSAKLDSLRTQTVLQMQTWPPERRISGLAVHVSRDAHWLVVGSSDTRDIRVASRSTGDQVLVPVPSGLVLADVEFSSTPNEIIVVGHDSTKWRVLRLGTLDHHQIEIGQLPLTRKAFDASAQLTTRSHTTMLSIEDAIYAIDNGLRLWLPARNGIRVSEPRLSVSGERFGVVEADGLLWRIAIYDSGAHELGTIERAPGCYVFSFDWIGDDHIVIGEQCGEVSTIRRLDLDRELHILKTIDVATTSGHLRLWTTDAGLVVQRQIRTLIPAVGSTLAGRPRRIDLNGATDSCGPWMNDHTILCLDINAKRIIGVDLDSRTRVLSATGDFPLYGDDDGIVVDGADGYGCYLHRLHGDLVVASRPLPCDQRAEIICTRDRRTCLLEQVGRVGITFASLDPTTLSLGATVHHELAPGQTSNDPVGAALSNDGQRLAIPLRGSGIVIVELATGSRYEISTPGFQFVAWLSADHLIASGSQLVRLGLDGTVEPVLDRPGLFAFVYVSPDGTHYTSSELSIAEETYLLEGSFAH